MTEKQFSESLDKAIRDAYNHGYRDGFFDGANKLIDRIEKLRTEYKNPDSNKGVM